MPEDAGSARPAETRKLAAIMFTDIVGFSRQMGADEARMLRLLDLHNQIIQQAVTEHHGTVIKTVGDAFLVDFPSVVHAVQCAQQVQAQFKAHNTEKEAVEQIHVRIGLHSGDIVQREGDVFGHGVNIASRLQELAAVDTICLSDMVYRDVAKKLDLGTVVSLGRPKLKNIAERFQVYALLLQPPSGVRQTLHIQWLKLKQKRRTVQAAAVVMLLLLGAGAVTLRTRYFSSLPALPLPDKPSIAVLPFDNLSEDPKQEYFSDGITEDLTSDLSKLSGLFVISRNSAFTYKGKAVKVQEVSKELGVQYVLEGSVRKADGQVRITAQLIDAIQDHHLWTERYDRPLQDIFALQDEIVQKIVTTLKLQLTLMEQGYLVRKRTDNLEAYDSWLRGLESLLRARDETKKELNVQARQMFEKAIELDPQYAEAYAGLGTTYFLERWYAWSQDPQTLERALELGQKAIALDGSLPGSHDLLGGIYVWKKQHDQAIAEEERAITLDPNDADGYVTLGVILAFAGRPEEGIGWIERGMRLNPHYPPWYLFELGQAYRLTGRYAEAVATLKEVISRSPNLTVAHNTLADSYVQQWAFQQSPDAQTLAQALAAALRAVALNDSYWGTHW